MFTSNKQDVTFTSQKRRLSWSDNDFSTTSSPIVCKRYHMNEKGKEIPGGSHSPVSLPQTHQSILQKKEPAGSKALSYSEPSLTWVHTSPLFSPPKSCPLNNVSGNETKHDSNTHLPHTVLSTSSLGSTATQDGAVSSTTFSSELVANQSQQETTNQTAEWGQPCLSTPQLSNTLLT